MRSFVTLAPDLILDKSSVDISDDWSLWCAAEDFLDWAINQAYLQVGEFPEYVYCLNKVSFYAVQVDNGGHVQFAKNCGWNFDTVDQVDAGLRSINATDFLSVYLEFRHVVDSDPQVRQDILRYPFKGIPSMMPGFDERFYGLGGSKRLVSYGAAWLRTLPILKLLSSEELSKEKQAISERNVNREARMAERIAAREAAQAADPRHVFARRLCALSGLEFVSLTAGRYQGRPDTMLWGVRTSGSVFYMLLGPDKAELQHFKTRAVLAAVAVGG